MKKIICLFALLFVSLFANANNIEVSTPKFVNLTESSTIAIENVTYVTSFIALEDIDICYTDTFRLLLYTYISPVTGVPMAVYRIYTVTTCIQM